MFYIRMVLRNIRRHKYKSFFNMMVCIAILGFLNIYTGNLVHTQEQLETISRTIPIKAVITNAAGDAESGLFIHDKRVQSVLHSSNIANAVFTLQSVGYINDSQVSLMAANTYRAFPGMEANNFFSSELNECLVTQSFLDNHHLKVGDEITVEQYYYELLDYIYQNLLPLDTITYTISGVVDEHVDLSAGDSLAPDILLPLNTVRNIYTQNNLTFFADSGSFTAANPLALNQLKEEMHEAGFMEVNSNADLSLDGNSLIIQDSTFIQTAGNLLKGHTVMQNCFPVILLLLILSGFVSSYLITNSRQEEFAIMRSLGIRKSNCIMTFLLENGILLLLSCIPGALPGILLFRIGINTLLLNAALFLFCYLAGTFAALIILSKISIVEVLTKAD